MVKCRRRSSVSGFSLIEVMIALVIFSFSLIGVAGMMSISMKGNHNGYLRSQAVILGNDMSSRMRANLAGLWGGHYNGIASVGETECSYETPCTPVELAEYDLQNWNNQIIALLPQGSGEIQCDTATLPAGILSSGNWVAYPPFPGICKINIAWNEINESGSVFRNMTLVVQP